ncbi:ABC transporter ATP-binding protein [Streptomyces sp. NPDC050560]|uniref:ABC transporter ATP-binding protein n=1 Tax=Streptomyces sp. NPDC050560 TaxID=3365630 RepID=UPI0037A2B356
MPSGPAPQGTSAERPVKIGLSHVRKRFVAGGHDVTAIEDFSFEVRQGEFLAVVGPSGCGKTTLLRILADLERHDDGEVTIVRKDPARPENSMILQGDSVFPWMTVRQNVEFGLRLRRIGRRERARQSGHYLERTGLTRFADSYPHQLSGGMRQRVSIARAFANDPEILLMDEPFGALDEQTKFTLQQELLQLWESTRKTVVFITHSLDEALTLADRVLVMTPRPGRISTVLDVPFARPRDVLSLRRDAHYGDLINRIWTALKPGAPAPPGTGTAAGTGTGTAAGTGTGTATGADTAPAPAAAAEGAAR